MKKLMSFLTLFLIVVGVSGCGNSAPTQISLQEASAGSGAGYIVVGTDIAPGTYNAEILRDNLFYAVCESESTECYTTNKNILDNDITELYVGATDQTRDIRLKKGNVIFYWVGGSDIILTKE